MRTEVLVPEGCQWEVREGLTQTPCLLPWSSQLSPNSLSVTPRIVTAESVQRSFWQEARGGC